MTTELNIRKMIRKLSDPKRHLSRGHLGANRAAPVLPLPRGEWPHYPEHTHLDDDCGRARADSFRALFPVEVNFLVIALVVFASCSLGCKLLRVQHLRCCRPAQLI